MALPRSTYVRVGQEGVYHCFSRCVRRAFLYGFDLLTRRDFSHRKAWLVERLRYLASIFAIEVCAYAVMENHYHAILRTRPDIIARWSDREVATRWLTLFPQHRDIRGTPIPPAEKEVSALVDCPDRMARLRRRLCNLSWFMGRLNEFIARAANKEDRVKGRFWESRYKCQVLLDEAAIAACMVYVDLNPIRTGLAGSPEGSDFTSIQERIRMWQQETKTTASVPVQAAQEDNDAILSANWLCPIQSDTERRGILQMTTVEYIDLVDRSARMTRPDKHGAMDAGILPILLRIGAKPEVWNETVSHFGSRFCFAAGVLSNLRNFADQLGIRWLKGITSARAAFASALPLV
jgi:hypothetical protein